MTWNRKLWGVHFIGGDGKPVLIGSAWREHVRTESKPYPGEPGRVLLFQNRKSARAWCKLRNAECSARTDFVNKWRYRVVRVREMVEACA